MENRRKLVHISMIIFAFLIDSAPAVVISLTCFAAFLFNVFLLPGLTSRILERKEDIFLGFSPGLILYPAVLFLISLLFFEQQVFLLIGWGAMAFGDGFANLIGRKYGKHKLFWNSGKSWEGFFACIFFGSLLTFLMLMILPDSLMLAFGFSHWLLVIVLANVFGAIWEAVPDTVDDNLVVPLAAALSASFFHELLQVDKILLPDNILVYLMVALVLGVGSLLTRKITLAGAVTGSGITYLLLLAFDWLGLIAIAVFFSLGSAASVWKKKQKLQMGVAEANEGKRSYPNVLANAAIPFFLAILSLVFPDERNNYEVMMMASFAAALSDTISSELGNVLGKNFYHILNLKPGERGEDGMISLEGSISGLVASLFIGTIYFVFRSQLSLAFLITIAGFTGNLTDSVLGASLQKKGLLNNHTVNFFNTLVAAILVAMILSF